MKRFFLTIMAVCLCFALFGLTGCATHNAGGKGESEAIKRLKPVVVAATPVVEIGKNAKVVMTGTGFVPGKEIQILFTTPNGLQSDIGNDLKPEPKADKTGTWGTTWNCGRFVKKKIIKEGVYNITVTDADYTPIAHTAVIFVK